MGTRDGEPRMVQAPRMLPDDDLELLGLWQAGQTLAGRELVRRHYAAVYRFFFSKVDLGSCEDLTQATFEVLWLSGWVPHESQQKPLRPGTAKSRLADALGTVELKPEPGRTP